MTTQDSAIAEDCAPRLDDEGRRLLRVVGDNANKMGRLIGDILDFPVPVATR